MGSSICLKKEENSEKELDKIIKGKICITKVPLIQKPSPIQSLKFLDDEVGIEKEQTLALLPKQSTSENLITNTDSKTQTQEVKQSVEQTLTNFQNDQLEQQNNSREDRSSQLNEGKDSINDVLRPKSILKNKTHGDSNPQSPKHHQKDLQTLSSQRSIKKVTFDKKQRVIYSSFRNQKS